jgi:hypothetical protein
MGKVECFSLPNLNLIFYSNDHLPAHFHVIGSKWEIKVYIETTTRYSLHYSIKWSRLRRKTPSAKSLRAIAAKVCDHRLQLLEEWERKVLCEL